MSYSRDERRALCALLDETGPDAPTLCAGWATRDLAAHLVLREHRMDADVGLLGGPLAGYTARVQRRLTERIPFPQLVEIIRDGPPRLSFFGLPGMDQRANMTEYFVHHEDVRRGAPAWEPRELSRGFADALWSRLAFARLILRKLPVGVEFARDDLPDASQEGGESQGPDSHQADGSRRLRMTVRNGTPVVTVVGHPAELTLWALGRTTVARVRMDGAETPVRTLTEARWRL